MSKIVIMTRNLGEYLHRYDESRFNDADGKTVQTATIVVPDARGELIRRVGKYIVLDNYLPQEVATEFEIGVIDSLNIHFDDNYDNFKINQDESSFEIVNEQKYKVRADIDKLKTYSVEGEGSHKYVVIGIYTGKNSIVGMTLNGKTLTEEDENKFKDMGYDAGYIMYWYPFELIESTIVLGNKGKNTAIDIISVK